MAKQHRQNKRTTDPPKLKYYCVMFPLGSASMHDLTKWVDGNMSEPHCRGCSIRNNEVMGLCWAYNHAEAAMLAVDKAVELYEVSFTGQTTIQVYAHQEGPQRVHYVKVDERYKEKT